MAVLKTGFVLLLIAFAMMVVAEAWVYVGPCDQVCSRINAEKDECCRAHGHSGSYSCSGGRMKCY